MRYNALDAGLTYQACIDMLTLEIKDLEATRAYEDALEQADIARWEEEHGECLENLEVQEGDFWGEERLKQLDRAREALKILTTELSKSKLD